ncbi:MAG: hypothetical protein JSS60_04335 [Verrucomicrobia bacterium]|nr:hypothetical protein [Verrucomicrobiota bacterium]
MTYPLEMPYFSFLPQVEFHFSDLCQTRPETLTHLVIYDYAQWSASDGSDDVDGDVPLFCLDSREGNIRHASATFNTSSRENLYLIKAYLDYVDSLHAIVQLEGNGRSFNLTLCQNNNRQIEFRLGSDAKILTTAEADNILSYDSGN